MNGSEGLVVSHHRNKRQPGQMRQQQFDGRIGGFTSAGAVEYQPKIEGKVLPQGLSVQQIQVSPGGEITHLDGMRRRNVDSAISLPAAGSASYSRSPKHEHSWLPSPVDMQDDVSGSMDSKPAVCKRPFQLHHGRKYIRDSSYPLPCDLQELQRQNLRTLLTCSVFGRPVCSPDVLARPPTRVLEVGCGTAYWTSRCHQMYSAMGHSDIMYTGLDVAELSPDLRKQGLRWSFVQHEMRRCPWPFDDETFDLIMCKDLSMAIPLGTPSQQMIDECIRLLRPGGTLEIWETDHTIRALQSHSPSIVDPWEQKVAEKTATFPMSPLTPFAPTANRYLKAANSWIDRALDERGLPSTPCARIAPILLQEVDSLEDIDFRRIAIPLAEIDWEQQARARQRRDDKGRSRSRARHVRLNSEQLALRETALLTVIQMIESLEPVLMKTSGKNAEEWTYWWASMISSLTDSSKKALNGECLEIGAWWATRRASDDDDESDD